MNDYNLITVIKVVIRCDLYSAKQRCFPYLSNDKFAKQIINLNFFYVEAD